VPRLLALHCLSALKRKASTRYSLYEHEDGHMPEAARPPGGAAAVVAIVAVVAVVAATSTRVDTLFKTARSSPPAPRVAQ
jgi:hypothetical protein